MSRPLELTIHPDVPRPRSNPPSYKWALERERELDLAYAKHLTDAELAAEYWAANTKCAATFPYPQAEWERAKTLHRFASRPHYFEDNA